MHFEGNLLVLSKGRPGVTGRVFNQATSQIHGGLLAGRAGVSSDPGFWRQSAGLKLDLKSFKAFKWGITMDCCLWLPFLAPSPPKERKKEGLPLKRQGMKTDPQREPLTPLAGLFLKMAASHFQAQFVSRDRGSHPVGFLGLLLLWLCVCPFKASPTKVPPQKRHSKANHACHFSQLLPLRPCRCGLLTTLKSGGPCLPYTASHMSQDGMLGALQMSAARNKISGDLMGTSLGTLARAPLASALRRLEKRHTYTNLA